MKKQAKRVYEFEGLVPPPPPMLVRSKIKFADLSVPLKIAAIMGLVEFTILALWLVFMFIVVAFIVVSSI